MFPSFTTSAKLEATQKLPQEIFSCLVFLKNAFLDSHHKLNDGRYHSGKQSNGYANHGVDNCSSPFLHLFWVSRSKQDSKTTPDYHDDRKNNQNVEKPTGGSVDGIEQTTNTRTSTLGWNITG